ncbi:MAG: helix-turn-helix transcriptional regulator [Clostridia bacterium]|nr:helix-turn-helix transcriptional regulator [Clostridia bacterium]
MLAEKIVILRKKHGMSQEAFAEQLDVSRQAVSKWESGSSFPEIDKIVRISELFGVSTDYLLKDTYTEGEEEKSSYCVEETEETPEDDVCPALVSKEEVVSYISDIKQNSLLLSMCVLLCIISPILLIFLAGASTYPDTAGFVISSELAAAIGIVILLLTVALAVAGFVFTGFRLAKCDSLAKGSVCKPGTAAYDMLCRERNDFERPFLVNLIIGIVLCILSPLPLIFSAVSEADLFYVVCSVDILLLVVSVGVFLIVRVSVIREGYEKLYSSYSINAERREKTSTAFSVLGGLEEIYWTLLLVVYLVWSFKSMDWHITWLVWVIGGVVWTIIESVFAMVKCKKHK